MIDWTKASDKELAEIYDALADRNERLNVALESVKFRLNIGGHFEALRNFSLATSGGSAELMAGIWQEITRRYPGEEPF